MQLKNPKFLSLMENQEFLKEFFNIIMLGKKSNTYKFALARSILEFVKKNETQIQVNIDDDRYTTIDYSMLADNFLRYYWYQEKSKIPQNFNADDLPHVIQILRKIFKDHSQPENFDMVPEELKEMAKKKILQKVFGKEHSKTSQVVPRFQNISVGKKTVKKETFYKNDEKNRRILVNPNAMKFFIHYRILLEKFVVLEWAKFLDSIRSSPGIVSKIEDPKFERKSLKPQEKVMKKYFETCFYCNEPLDRLTVHVDHFIPFSYIFENELWNLVLSCSKCNLNKSDSLPMDFKDMLIEQKDKFRKKIPDLNKSLRKLDNGFGWKKEMERIYRNCLEYGFTEIGKAEILKRK